MSSLALSFVLLAASATAQTTASPTVAPAIDPIFDQNRLHEVRLYIDPADWRALQANYLTNQYYAADISLDGVVVHQVGLRSRGSGSRSETKPGLKVDFDKYVPSQKYGEYGSLDLKNLVQDPSFLRERLTFAVFEAMGIDAPLNSFARLYVNEEYWGLYEVDDPVRKPFLRARFAEDTGNLFKYGYVFAWDFSFRGDDPGAYVPAPFEPKTNEDHLDASGLVDFVRAVNGTPDETFTRDIAAWLDLDRFLTYLAVENAVAETDGFLGAQGTNNFFLYQYAEKRRFVFIPWDKDSSFSVPSQSVFLRVETNVLARRLLADPAMQAGYVSALRRAVTSFVNDRWLTPRLETAYTQIREAALTDTKKPFTNDEFELAVGGVRGIIASREADILAQTGGK